MKTFEADRTICGVVIIYILAIFLIASLFLFSEKGGLHGDGGSMCRVLSCVECLLIFRGEGPSGNSQFGL